MLAPPAMTLFTPSRPSAPFYDSFMPARILIFWPPGDFITSSRQLTERHVENDFDDWLVNRKKMVAVFGTLNPHPGYDPRLGRQIEPTPPDNPLMLPEGPARASADCLRLVHRYSQAEWAEVQLLHQKMWDRFNEEDRKQKEAELAARPTSASEPETRYSWGKRHKAAMEATKSEVEKS
jgi:hypothetical protein